MNWHRSALSGTQPWAAACEVVTLPCSREPTYYTVVMLLGSDATSLPTDIPGFKWDFSLLGIKLWYEYLWRDSLVIFSWSVLSSFVWGPWTLLNTGQGNLANSVIVTSSSKMEIKRRSNKIESQIAVNYNYNAQSWSYNTVFFVQFKLNSCTWSLVIYWQKLWFNWNPVSMKKCNSELTRFQQ